MESEKDNLLVAIKPQTQRQKNTAVLLFANSGKKEATSKKFIGKGKKLNTQIASALNKHAIATVKAAGINLVLMDETKQRGNSFGEKLWNASEDVFALGYQSIIVIGNDSPQLNAEHLQFTAKQLNNNKPVIGPSADGGFYLLGMHKNDFDKVSFLNLPWRKANLFFAVKQHFNQQNQVAEILAELTDADDEASLKRILKVASLTVSLNPFLKLLLNLFNSLSEFATILNEQINEFLFISKKSSRAPPLSV
ncbi:TIGR04282 family arsenosugar biosynthesis glycosyltransferase [Chondrinema litorale]|uniref:TIGR04282 family arsenosugar biosynthesis glycosyltransferase n=1 Tax=Chondrinema litorale TaxID=2994555 RepID=UPI002542A6CE|nr:DUF2064 domain-containing protein [Chondrinema litorale]UZR97914.1 DUF2064 domain-containing protein [Chondrinema litorale]